MQQVKDYSDKVGKLSGGTGRGKGGRGQSTTSQDWGGKSDIINTNPSTKNVCYHCGKTEHILHFFPDLTKNQRAELYIQMNKQTEYKKNSEEKLAPFEEGQLHLQVDSTEVAAAAAEEDMMRKYKDTGFGFLHNEY